MGALARYWKEKLYLSGCILVRRAKLTQEMICIFVNSHAESDRLPACPPPYKRAEVSKSAEYLQRAG